MRLCILETDINDDPGLEMHGSYPAMFRTWLAPALPEAEFHNLPVHAGSPLPAPQDYDAYLVTGSRHGVYDDLPWIAPLAEFLRQLKTKDIPVAGICFGHQIMAQAFGARVEKSAHGWVIGAQTYDGKTAFAMHQDQVLEVPRGAAEITASPHCAIARIAYEFPALSVQYHPEFTRDFMQALLDIYGAQHIAPARVAAARATLDDQTHVTQIARDFAAFFRAHVTQPAQ